jgi:acetyl esterase/lipase
VIYAVISESGKIFKKALPSMKAVSFFQTLICVVSFTQASFGDPSGYKTVQNPKAPPSYEEQQAKIKSLYQKLLPSLPKGTVSLIDQPYVENPPKGIMPDSTQKLDLFVPAGKGPFPLIVVIHGGGWHAGGKDWGIAAAQTYLPKGFAVAGIDYRWVQDAPFPAQIEDCNTAITWLRAHASQYHLDPDRIGVMGHSAGAHLCALIATTGDGTTFKNPQKVQAVLCESGPFDLDRDRGKWPLKTMMWKDPDPMASFFPEKKYDGAFARYASPQSYIHPGIPPIMIVHGEKDTLVPSGQAEVFAEDLKKAGVDVDFRITVGRDHGTVMDDKAKADAVAFFERYLAKH